MGARFLGDTWLPKDDQNSPKLQALVSLRCISIPNSSSSFLAQRKLHMFQLNKLSQIGATCKSRALPGVGALGVPSIVSPDTAQEVAAPEGGRAKKQQLTRKLELHSCDLNDESTPSAIARALSRCRCESNIFIVVSSICYEPLLQFALTNLAKATFYIFRLLYRKYTLSLLLPHTN